MGYPGGKGRLYQRIISMMPPHDVYVETHLGGGAVLRHKHPARRNVGIDVDTSVISRARSWNIPNLELHYGKAETFLQSGSLDGSALVYLDPPYVGSTKSYRSYYKFEYSDADHLRLLNIIKDLECLVMISGYDTALYRQRLSNWCRTEMTNITHHGPRQEVVWTNFEPTSALHDYSRIGTSFRDRERIRRKIERWTRKFCALPPLERHAIIDAFLRSEATEMRVAQHALDKGNAELRRG